METVKFIYVATLIAPSFITVAVMLRYRLERKRFMKVSRENSSNKIKIDTLEKVLMHQLDEHKSDQRKIDSLEEAVRCQDILLDEYRRVLESDY